MGSLHDTFDPLSFFEKAVAVTHARVMSGQAPLPLPKGCRVWHGPVLKPTEIVGR